MHVGWSAGGQSELWCHGNKRSSKNLEKWSSLHSYILWIWSTFLISGRLSTWWISTKIHGTSQHGSDPSFDWIPSLEWYSHVGNQPKNKRLIIQWWALLFSSFEPWQCNCLQITKSVPRKRRTTKPIGQTNKVHTCVPVPEALCGSACDNHR
jgi:hypothetical protein